MMYEEFCQGVGMTIDPKCYERIEDVYMHFARFGTKQDIYDFYKKHDMNGIESLYLELHHARELSNTEAESQEELHDLLGTLVTLKEQVARAMARLEDITDKRSRQQQLRGIYL